MARARVTAKGQWILGRGWDQNDWPATAMPDHHALSRAVPDHPVRLTRIDGHAALVNAKAMELAHITRETPDPAGGAILHDASGEPTGVLVDGARALKLSCRAELAVAPEPAQPACSFTLGMIVRAG